MVQPLSTDTTTRKTDFQIFLNGENIVDTPQLSAGLNGGQNGTVTVGGGTTDEHSFSIADFKAYGTALTGQEIKEAWNMVPEPAAASLSVLGLMALLVRRRK